MEGRPILVATIGYIIGILWGLYLKSSIVPFYILIIATYYTIKNIPKSKQKRKFKLLSFYRYSRYVKLIFNLKILLIISIFSIISNNYILLKNKQYENTYQNGDIINIQGIVISQKIEKEYYNLYQIKILNSKKLNLYIQVSKKIQELEYGDKIKIKGEYCKPSKQRNYGGYDDEQYLKTLKIIGRMKVQQITILDRKQQNAILQWANDIKSRIIQKIENNFDNEKASILKGLLLGETDDISDETREQYRMSSISHILAISGMHIHYIIIGIQLLLKKIIGKRKAKVITIIILIMYIFITGFSPSIMRAVIMGILTLIASIIYRKNDIWNSIAISLLIILIYNPFLIYHVGLQLSYLGTIGILLCQFDIQKKLKKIPIGKETLAVSISAQIMILPIMLYHFNIFGIYFLITNLLVSLIICPTILLGFFSLILEQLSIFTNIGLELLNFISNFSQLPFSKIYFITPNLYLIIFYYIILLIFRCIYQIYHTKYLTATQKRVKNIIALFRYKFSIKKKKYTKIVFLLIIFLSIIKLCPKDLKINFVDIGQGDCTFIITPQNKTILVDGGGSLNDSFDVGKKTLIPYLLDKGYRTIDYVIISHFDQDHVRWNNYGIGRIKSKANNNW